MTHASPNNSIAGRHSTGEAGIHHPENTLVIGAHDQPNSGVSARRHSGVVDSWYFGINRRYGAEMNPKHPYDLWNGA